MKPANPSTGTPDPLADLPQDALRGLPSSPMWLPGLQLSRWESDADGRFAVAVARRRVGEGRSPARHG